MPLLFKTTITALAIMLAPALAQAASFSAKRGINLDIWTTWPDESRWNDPDVLLPFPEWRRTVGADQLSALKEAGFDFVRIPVDPSPFLSRVSAPLRERLIEEVRASVGLVNGAGLKAIVDMHLFPAGSNRSIGMAQVMDDAGMFDRYVETLRDMASAFRDADPGQVALELMNEPVIDCDGEGQWPARLKQLYAAVRASATRLTLILEGGCWGGADGLAALDPADYPDDNIVWSFHSYAPFLLTHQGATWAGDFIPYVTGIPYPPHAVPKAEMDAILDTIRARIQADAPWARRAGMLQYLDEEIAKIDTAEKLKAAMDAPFETVAKWASAHGGQPENIILSEFGMIRQEYGNPFVMPGASRAGYVKDMIGLAEQHGYAWSMWSYGGAFGVVEEFEGRKAEPDVMDMVRKLPR